MAIETTHIVSRGRPIEVSGVELVPVSRSTLVSSSVAGVVWSRPSEVIVRRGSTRVRLHISHTAGKVCSGLWAVGIGGTLAAWWLRRRRERR